MPERSGDDSDLGAVFDTHLAAGFETKDLDATTATMVDPSVLPMSGAEPAEQVLDPAHPSSRVSARAGRDTGG